MWSKVTLHHHHQWSSLHAVFKAKYRASPDSSFISLWGVSVIWCFSILFFAVSSWIYSIREEECSVLSTNISAPIKGRQSYLVMFHWLTALWIFNGIFYVVSQEVNKIWNRKSSTSVFNMKGSLLETAGDSVRKSFSLTNW